MIIKLVKDAAIDGVFHNLGETVETAQRIGEKLVSRGYAKLEDFVEEAQEEEVESD